MLDSEKGRKQSHHTVSDERQHNEFGSRKNKKRFVTQNEIIEEQNKTEKLCENGVRDYGRRRQRRRPGRYNYVDGEDEADDANDMDGMKSNNEIPQLAVRVKLRCGLQKNRREQVKKKRGRKKKQKKKGKKYIIIYVDHKHVIKPSTFIQSFRLSK